VIVELAPETKDALRRAKARSVRRPEHLVGGEDILAALSICTLPRRVAAALATLGTTDRTELNLRSESLPALRELTHEARHSLATTWRIATILHVDAPLPGHLLLGLLAEPQSVAAQLGRTIGLSFEDACEEIVGWRIPQALLGPHAFEVPDGEPVELSLDAFRRVFGRLKAELPDDAPLAFNLDDTHAWVRTRHDVDLAGAIRRIETRSEPN